MLAAAKAFGLHRTVVATALLVVLTVLCAPDEALGVPTIEAPIEVLQMVPVLAALLLPMGLVDLTDDLLSTTGRRLAPLFASRLLVVLACGALVALRLRATGTSYGDTATIVLLALGIAGAAVARAWYWAAVVIAGYLWLQSSTGPHAAWFGPGAALASIVAAAAVYVVGSTIRVRRD